jgi:hypothetical protein
MKNKWFLAGFLVVATAGLTIARYGVFGRAGSGRSSPPVMPAETLEAHARLTPEVEAILERACRDCHTSRTVWPWYSRVPPVAWMVLDHVHHGRSHLNFSKWGAYPREERARLLEKACQLAAEGAMPLPSYTFIHDRSQLSDGDVNALCAWTREERARVLETVATHP